MALPLTLGLLCAGLAQGMRGLRPGLRYRILWLSSPEASRLVLLGAAALIMATSLMLTMSRSGISALIVSLVLMASIIARGVSGRSRRTAAAALLVALFVTAAGWVGTDAILARFSDANWAGFNNRTGAWADALHVAKAFPATGTGLNTYETAARFYQRHDLDQFYGESHNDYLELLAEGGALVGVPILAALLLLAREIRRRMKLDPPTTVWWVRRGAITGLFAIAIQETVEFSLQMPGNAVMFALLCAMALHRPREARQGSPQPEPAPARPRLRVVASNAMRVEVGR
jgi:O-antigen ligase